ncbi:MAG: hypothetical protein Q9214_004069, partial [Letrouitia sp. 1 TL-2023]
MALGPLYGCSKRDQLLEPSPYVPGLSTELDAVRGAAAHGRDAALRILIEHGVDLETTNPPHGDTPLYLAAHLGFMSTAKLLLDAGANVNGSTSSGANTALFGAIVPSALYPNHRDQAIVRLLLERGADPNHRDSQSRRALHLAALYGEPDTVEILLKFGATVEEDDDAETPLMTASEGHNPPIVRCLLQHGASVNRRDSQGKSALARLSEQSQWKKVDIETLKVLLAHHANVNDRSDGCTPLLFAMEMEAVEVSRLLLQGGADVDDIDHSSRSALGVLCSDLIGNRFSCEVMELLVNAGADVNFSGPGVAPPLHLVATTRWLRLACRLRLMQVLLEAGADPEAQDHQG